MKKIILTLVFIALYSHGAFAQCTEPIALPYSQDAESTTVPQLPDCVTSGYLAFSSSEIFETTATPVAGFTGNAFVYDTTVGEGITENAWVAVTLGAAEIAFEAGTSYQVSFRYGMENPEGTIGMLRIMLARQGQYIDLHEQENIAAGTASDFVSAPFTLDEADSYYFILEFQLEGGQGDLFIDDIVIEEASIAGVGDNVLSDLAVYPNPASDQVTITGKNEISRAEVYTLHGQKILERNEGNIQQLSTAELANGVYILKVYSGNESKAVKLVKK